MRKLILLALLLALATPLTAARRRGVSPDSCSVALTPQAVNLPGAGGQATVTVNIRGGCSWAPSTAATWMTVTPAGNVLTITAAANPAQTPRSALVNVRGGVIVVTQSAGEIQNLVTNSGFTSSIANWTDIYSVGTGSASWSAGTAQITSTQFRSGFQLHQCVNVDPTKTYSAGTRVFIPAGQSGSAVFAIFPLRVRDCTNTAYDTPLIVNRSAPAGEWFEINETFRPFAATLSVLIVIGAGGSDVPPFTAHFDDVYLRAR